MSTFTDDAGRPWSLDLSVADLAAVRRELGLSLLPLGGSAARLSADPALLVDVLYVCCRGQAEAAGVGDEDFGRSLAGSVGAATGALLAALVAFAPGRDRPVLAAILAHTAAGAGPRMEQLT